MSYWFVSLPSDPKDKGYDQLMSSLNGSGSSISGVAIPDFIVGNLDSLMSLSDDLNKQNTTLEGVLRKIERQYMDISSAMQNASASSDNSSASGGASNEKAEKLRINGLEIEKYLHQFKWDPTNFPFHAKPMQEICATISQMTSRVDDELKRFSVSYQEKSQNIAALQRRKTVNMTTSDFEDFLKPEDVAKLRINVDSEYLQTLMIIVPRSLSEQFDKEYANIGDKIGHGGKSWQGNENLLGNNDGKFGDASDRSRTFSPVVPGSLKIVLDDEKMDSKLYLVQCLKGHYTAGKIAEVDGVPQFVDGHFTDYIKPIKEAFRESKYTAREFSYNMETSRAGGLDSLIAIAKREVEEIQKSLSKWCATNFSQVFSGWIHLRVIKAYAESVLRYGLPATQANLNIFILMPNVDKEKQIKDQLTGIVSRLRPHLVPKKSALEEDEEEDLETLPFVCQKFAGIGIVQN